MPVSALRNFHYEFLLGIGGALGLAGFFLPWAKGGDIPLRGFEQTTGSLTFIGAWLMIIAAMIGYDLFRSRKLEEMKPYTDSGIGIIGAILGLLGIALFKYNLPSAYSLEWGVGLITAIVGGAIGIFSSLMILWQTTTTENRTRPRGKSGGGL